jgi:hypothetical protein
MGIDKSGAAAGKSNTNARIVSFKHDVNVLFN